nr:uncharacterized protein LOC110075770 isoform X1 [Pogona vitticeps]
MGQGSLPSATQQGLSSRLLLAPEQNPPPFSASHVSGASVHMKAVCQHMRFSPGEEASSAVKSSAVECAESMWSTNRFRDPAWNSRDPPEGMEKDRTVQESSEPPNHVAAVHAELLRSGMRPSRAREIPHPSASSSSLQSLYHFLLAVSLMGLSTSQPPQCQREQISLLSSMIQLLGNSSGDGALYTPQDITVCYADNLKCFYLELQVMLEEQEEHKALLSRLILRLGKKRQAEGWIQRCPTCKPCESHPRKPMLAFLKKLWELFRFSCITSDGPRRGDCPSPAP